MNAKKIIGEAPGGTRTPLSELVPLTTPMLLQMFPAYVCNFRCKYCVFSTEKSERGFVSDKILMEYELFTKIIDECINFEDKIRVLRFVGMGEPLIHKDLSKMVKYASKSNKFDRIEILTNASLLTKDISDELIESGLTKLLVSIQGTSSEKYKIISDVNIDIQLIIDNLKYFYNNKKSDTKIHVKIIDCALDGKDDEELFYKLFGDICDTIGIEVAGPIFPMVDYNGVLKESSKNTTQFGMPTVVNNICPQPFFSLQINPDGNVVPCYSIAYPIIIGNCNRENIVDIWNGKKYNDFRLKMLSGKSLVCDVCKECEIANHRSFSGDDLTTQVDRLKQIYGK